MDRLPVDRSPHSAKKAYTCNTLTPCNEHQSCPPLCIVVDETYLVALQHLLLPFALGRVAGGYTRAHRHQSRPFKERVCERAAVFIISPRSVTRSSLSHAVVSRRECCPGVGCPLRADRPPSARRPGAHDVWRRRRRPGRGRLHVCLSKSSRHTVPIHH